MDQDQPRSRRGVLAAALGAVAGSVAATVARPGPAQASTAIMYAGQDNAIDARTRLYRTNNGVVFSAFSPTMPAFELGSEIVAVGSNVDSGVAIWAKASGQYAVAIEAAAPDTGAWGISATGGAIGVEGESSQVGIRGVGGTAGVVGHTVGANGNGVQGEANGNGAAVAGIAGMTATGGKFSSDAGLALDVAGRARFSRSGRVSVAANHTYVDITVAGGLASTAFVVATLQTYRSGVYVAAVRPNYPSTGKARIYLNKVASTTSSTVVGWIAIG